MVEVRARLPTIRSAAVGRVRTSLQGVMLVAFCLQFAILYLALRRGQPFSLASCVQSACFWALLALASRYTPVRVLTALLAGCLLALQSLFFRRYGTWMDIQVIKSTIRFWADIRPSLGPFLPGLVLASLGAAIVEYLWLRAFVPGLLRSR